MFVIEIDSHVIVVIIIMWGVAMMTTVITACGSGCELNNLKLLVAFAMLATLGMLFHPRWRHYLLLPSCVALAGGVSALLVAFHMPWH